MTEAWNLFLISHLRWLRVLIKETIKGIEHFLHRFLVLRTFNFNDKRWFYDSWVFTQRNNELSFNKKNKNNYTTQLFELNQIDC